MINTETPNMKKYNKEQKARLQTEACDICNRREPDSELTLFTEDDGRVRVIHVDCISDEKMQPVYDYWDGLSDAEMKEYLRKRLDALITIQPDYPLDLTGKVPSEYFDGTEVLLPPGIDASLSTAEIEERCEDYYKIEERTQGEWYLSIFPNSERLELVINYDWHGINREEWKERHEKGK